MLKKWLGSNIAYFTLTGVHNPEIQSVFALVPHGNRQQLINTFVFLSEQLHNSNFLFHLSQIGTHRAVYKERDFFFNIFNFLKLHLKKTPNPTHSHKAALKKKLH